MYKDKFKGWQWSKNLPHKKAAWMLKRLHEHRPHKVVFEYGNQKWDEERLRKISDRLQRTEDISGGKPQLRNGSLKSSLLIQADGWSPCAPTPSDIQYSTALPIANDTPRDVQDHRTPTEVRHRDQWGEPFDFDSKPTTLDLRRVTIADLRRLLESAATAASAGLSAQAEANFRETLLGFRHLLSPTHDETLRAGYHLASFYANIGRMETADLVLSWMTSTHIKEWGTKHDKTMLHYVRVVDLLQSWNRSEQAEITIHKLIDDSSKSEDALSWMASQNGIRGPPMPAGGSDFHDLSSPQSDDPATITHQLRMIDLSLAVNIHGPLNVLPSIIAHCKNLPGILGAQEIKATCLLAKLHLDGGRLEQAQNVLITARQRAFDILQPNESLPDKTVVDATRQLAFVMFEVDESACNSILNQIISVLETRTIYGDQDRRYAVLMDFIWSIASEFNRISAWEKCKPWIERGLGLTIKNDRSRSTDAKRLQDILAQERFAFRSSDHVEDLMDFSKGLFRIRLV